MPEYIKHGEGTFTSLTKQQKEAVGLLSIGTFLEYFDLMLYVHMAVLLNELFFPKSDPFGASLQGAFAFCSVFVLRPVGAFIFGRIGDHIGRKVIVVITTFLMSISCIIMATVPTYAQIGIVASVIVTICRMLQGMSSMGEIIGAEIYLTEMIRPPVQYPTVMLIAISSILGGTAALGIAFVTTWYELNWRIAFWIGAAIALIGSIARTALKESKDFADAKHQLKDTMDKLQVNINTLQKDPILYEAVKKNTTISLFLIQCGWPMCFYLTYIYCSNILKNKFGYTPEEIISHNFYISIINLLGYIFLTYLSCRIHPLKILKAKVFIFFPVALFYPYIWNYINDPSHVFLLQSFIILFVLSTNPATPIFYKHIPIFKRVTYGGFIYAVSRAIMHIITSFGIIYIEKYLGQWGVSIIILPMIIGYGLGVLYFVKLETEVGTYHDIGYNRTSLV
ncbi:MFS transporter [Rickettsia conorii]|uniref:MFS transporter n=1 Tax=Rickettsia conorii TaxID=781 RepID=UPI000973C417|nr:MFS transporter [Rickettsia conorii]APZ30072.1 MFS transporter [Rickettsia conorii subsp. raoultii]